MNIQDEINNIKEDIKKIFKMLTPETHEEPVEVKNDEEEIQCLITK